MSHLTYEQGKKRVFQGLIILGVVTLIEVFASLAGKGYIIKGLETHKLFFYIIALTIVVLSLYKAYFIIFEFMHMKYEVKDLARTVLLPTALLIWAIIAFIKEGAYWKHNRGYIESKNNLNYHREQVQDKEMHPAPSSGTTEPQHH